MPFVERKYKYNQGILKSYGDGKYKLSVHNTLRTKGIECDDDFRNPKGTVNDEKLIQNINHTKNTIFELAYCNSWDYFCTFTIDGSKFDRYDLENYHKKLSQWIRDYNKKYGTVVKYLTIPETHKDGAWHEHGLIVGLPIEYLTLFDLKDHIPKYIRDKLKKGELVYNWTSYSKKFGFCDFEPIKNKEAVSNYIRKYITKDLARSVSEINAHLYYCSKGLNRAKEIKRGTMQKSIIPDFKNDFVMVKWFDRHTSPDTLKAMISSD